MIVNWYMYFINKKMCLKKFDFFFMNVLLDHICQANMTL